MKAPTGKPRRWRRWFLRLAIVAVGVAILYSAWSLFSRRGSTAASGTYLMAGGQSYIVIDRASLGRLRVSETGGIATHPFKRGQSSAWTAQFGEGRLILTQTERFVPSPPSARFDATLCLTLERSPRANGDWDAVAGYDAMGPRLASLGWFFQAARNSGTRETAKTIFAGIGSLFGARGMVMSEMDETMSPFKSFLHRVEDPRVVEYSRDRFSGEPTTATLTLVRALAAEHPSDPYLALHRIDVETKVGDPIEAANLLKQWENSYASTPDVLLAESAKRVRLAIGQTENRRVKPDLLPLLEAGPPKAVPTSDTLRRAPSEWDLSRTLKWLQDLSELPGLPAASAHIGLVLPARRSDAVLPARQVPDFANVQTSVKAGRAVGILRLLEGRYRESLALFAGSYRFGQALNASGTLVQRLIGIAVRAFGAEGLRIYALNACETPLDVEECWAMLEKLDKTPGQETGDSLMIGERTPVIALMKPVGPFAPNFLEAEIRHAVADMKFQLVRMAAAAWYRFLSTGLLPQSNAEFDLFGSEGLPADEFASSAPLKFVQPEKGDFTVYSVGPDRDDDRAAIVYDTSNGSASDGDIFVRVPREREFPFRREGVRAADAADFFRQFPNGLPTDPFSPVRGRPLSILDSTTTQPVVVFSFGPDCDGPYWRELLRASAAIPAAPDALGPPVGTTSPAPSEPTPGSRAEEPLGRRMQLVFERADEGFPDYYYNRDTQPPPRGTRPKWRLQCFYDPTNGTTSRGDIYVEIATERP